MKTKKKYRLKIIPLLIAAMMVLGACGNRSQPVDPPPDAPVDTVQTTPAEVDTDDTPAEPETVATDEEPEEGLIYDGAEDLLKAEQMEDTPYPGHQGLPGTGYGRITTAGEVYIYYVEDMGLGISNRVESYDSIDFLLGDLEPGNYTLVVDFYCKDELEFSIQEADGPWGTLISDTGSNVTLSYDFMITETGKAGEQNRLRLNATQGITYYVSGIKLYEAGGDFAAPDRPTVDTSLPSLAEVYKDHFIIGNIFSERDITNENRLDMLRHHYNVVTAENAMKPDAMIRAGYEFTFDAVDNMLDVFMSEGFQIVGHTLAWHNQSPPFLHTRDDGTPMTIDEAKESLDKFIGGVAGHYAGKILAWDVLNEAIEDGRSGAWRSTLRKSGWFNAFANGGNGEDYVEYAFRAAREADPNAILYYNDYNLDYQDKAQNAANMISEINAKYLAEGNERLLIEGVGMQGHYSTNTSVENVEASLKTFINLGVEVSITELDVTVPGGADAISAEFEQGQALKYAELFALYKKYSDHIARVTFWGLCDGSSWRSSQFPQIFNADFTPKLAYYAVIDPEGYLADNGASAAANLSRSGEAKAGTPAIDAENLDALWDSAEKLPIDTMVQAWQTATGTARALWDKDALYVLVEVNDSDLDAASNTVHEQDSVEVFVGFENSRNGSYSDSDGQYRVSFENRTSGGGSTNLDGFESNVFITSGGYRVVMKIPYQVAQPKSGAVIAFDAQVNDAVNGSRAGIAKYNDPTDASWTDTTNWGTLTLVD